MSETRMFDFPSLESNQFAYRVSSEYWDHRRNGEYLDSHFLWFYTYGDGMTQHAQADLVQKDRFVDCLGSLAVFLAANPQFVSVVAGGWPGETRVAEFKFAASVKFKEGKRAYYSKSEQKVSGSESKKYDKRWDEVPSWADGQGEAIFQLLSPMMGYFEGVLKRYARLKEVQEFCADNDIYAGKCATKYFDIPGVENFFDAPELVFEAVAHFVRGYQANERGRFLAGKYQEVLAETKRRKEATIEAVA